MIIRLVEMTFKPDKVDSFLENFHANKTKIRHTPGCMHLELWQDADNKNVFYTYSYWESEEALEQYRKSELFLDVWAHTKIHFSAKPRARTINREVVV